MYENCSTLYCFSKVWNAFWPKISDYKEEPFVKNNEFKKSWHVEKNVQAVDKNNNAPKYHFILIQKVTYMEMAERSHSILLKIHNTNWKEKKSFLMASKIPNLF